MKGETNLRGIKNGVVGRRRENKGKTGRDNERETDKWVSKFELQFTNLKL